MSVTVKLILVYLRLKQSLHIKIVCRRKLKNLKCVKCDFVREAEMFINRHNNTKNHLQLMEEQDLIKKT